MSYKLQHAYVTPPFSYSIELVYHSVYHLAMFRCLCAAAKWQSICPFLVSFRADFVQDKKT